MTDQKRKRFGWMKLLLVVAFIAIAIPAAWIGINYRPITSEGQPLVAVSPEVTWLTEPLDENGDVDYLEAINQRLEKEINPENNAAVFYFRATGPGDLGPELEQKLIDRFGLNSIDYCSTPFVDFDKWSIEAIQSRDGPDGGLDGAGKAREQFWFLVCKNSGPWTNEAYPEVNNWMESNEAAIALVRKGTALDQFYCPLVSNSEPRVLSSRLPLAQSMRDLARHFDLSASRYLGANDVEQFLAELRQMDRLGEHVNQGPTLVERLISIAIKRMVMNRIVSACATERNAEDLQEFLKFVDSLDVGDDTSARFNNLERLMILDTTTSMGRGKASGEIPVGFTPGMVNWDETLRYLNLECDRVAQLLDHKGSHKAFRTKCRDAEERLTRLKDEVHGTSLQMVFGGRAAKGQWTGKMLATMLLPAFSQVADAEAKLRSLKEMTRLAIAVSAFRRDSGQLPEELQQLAPKYLDRIPLDPWSGESFVLTKTDQQHGFRIESTEAQEADELGDDAFFVEPKIISFDQYINDR